MSTNTMIPSLVPTSAPVMNDTKLIQVNDTEEVSQNLLGKEDFLTTQLIKKMNVRTNYYIGM